MGQGREPGEPGSQNPDTHGLTVLEDLGVGATSPGAALLATLASAPRTTKSCNKPTTLSPSQGPVSVTSTPGTTIADAATSRRRITRIDEMWLLSQQHHFLIQGKRGEAGVAQTSNQHHAHTGRTPAGSVTPLVFTIVITLQCTVSHLVNYCKSKATELGLVWFQIQTLSPLFSYQVNRGMYGNNKCCHTTMPIKIRILEGQVK
jgi:hypothetical protein